MSFSTCHAEPVEAQALVTLRQAQGDIAPTGATKNVSFRMTTNQGIS